MILIAPDISQFLAQATEIAFKIGTFLTVVIVVLWSAYSLWLRLFKRE